jgi:hypothetical protein
VIEVPVRASSADRDLRSSRGGRAALLPSRRFDRAQIAVPSQPGLQEVVRRPHLAETVGGVGSGGAHGHERCACPDPRDVGGVVCQLADLALRQGGGGPPLDDPDEGDLGRRAAVRSDQVGVSRQLCRPWVEQDRPS